MVQAPDVVELPTSFSFDHRRPRNANANVRAPKPRHAVFKSPVRQADRRGGTNFAYLLTHGVSQIGRQTSPGGCVRAADGPRSFSR